jgi:multiple sugar transport system substrate-binding protein
MSEEKKEEKKEEKAISRRKYLGTVGGLAAATIVGWGLAGYLASRPPAPAAVRTVTETKTVTVTPAVTTPVTTPKPTWPPKVGAASLTVLSSPDCADFLKYAADEFHKMYPQVSIDVVPLSWEALYPKILHDLTSKTGAYDLFTIDVMTLGSVVEAGSMNLDDLRAKNPDLVDPDLDLKDFEPGYFGYGSIWAGSNYGLPVYPNHMFLYYRKDYFEDPKLQAKYKELTGKTLEPPKTWEDCIEVAKFFTKEKNKDSPTDYGIALMFPTTHTMMYNVLNWLGPIRQSPSGIEKYGKLDLYYGDYCTADGKVWFANEDGERAVKLIQDLLPYSPDPFGSDYGETLAQFSKGLTAMCPQWSVPYGDFVKSLAGGDLMKARDIIGVTVMPGIMDQGQLVRRPVSGGWAMGVNGSSKAPREAYLFAQFATSKRMDKVHWTKFVMPPARMSNWVDPESREVLSPALFDTYAESMRILSYRPRIPQEPEMERVGNPIWQDIIAGRTPTVLDGLKKLASEWQKLVDQFKHPGK